MGIFCLAQETTEKVLADRRTQAERERQIRMFEQAPGFVAMPEGPEHRFGLANPAYLRVVGHRDVVGRTVAEALPDAVEQGYLELLDEIYRSGRACTWRLRARSLGRGRKPWPVRTTPCCKRIGPAPASG